jgi:hypothetical protein
MDYLTLIRDAPDRALDAKSSRVRVGSLGGAPDSDIDRVSAEGVTDFARRWTYVSQELALERQAEAPDAGRIRRFTRALAEEFNKPDTLLFIDGTVFMRQPGGSSRTVGAPSAYAPRHPNDPAWHIDILYGARSPVHHQGPVDVDASTLVHLSGVADLDAANRASPNGVRPRLPGRRADREPVPFHIWLNAEGLAVRISIEQKVGFPARDRFWTVTEFFDYGVEVEELWSSTVGRRAAR